MTFWCPLVVESQVIINTTENVFWKKDPIIQMRLAAQNLKRILDQSWGEIKPSTTFPTIKVQCVVLLKFLLIPSHHALYTFPLVCGSSAFSSSLCADVTDVLCRLNLTSHILRYPFFLDNNCDLCVHFAHYVLREKYFLFEGKFKIYSSKFIVIRWWSCMIYT